MSLFVTISTGYRSGIFSNHHLQLVPKPSPAVFVSLLPLRHLSHLRGHSVRAHGGEKSFECGACGKRFVYAYQGRSGLVLFGMSTCWISSMFIGLSIKFCQKLANLHLLSVRHICMYEHRQFLFSNYQTTEKNGQVRKKSLSHPSYTSHRVCIHSPYFL